MPQELSAIGRAVLIAREGRKLTAYRDSVGVWTIGIGCITIYGRPVRKGDVITSAECDALFETTVAKYVAAVRSGLRVAVSQNAFDALVSICYNIGIAGFQGSTFLRRLNAGDVAGARDAILMWQKPAAIITRRQAEAEQFVTPYATAMPRATSKAAPVVATAPAKPTIVATLPPAAVVVEPVIVPAKTSWLSGFGAWVDRVWGGGGMPDVAARG